jgi:hypothetical protein
VSLDPGAWSQGDDRFAIEVNAAALAATGYQPSHLAQAASVTIDPTERARLYALAASGTEEPSQQLTWIADIARSSYHAARYQDAIRSAKFLAEAAETKLPANDPKAVSLQMAARRVQGWAYLRTGDLEKFNELASSYATKYTVAKEDFKEPVSPLPTFDSQPGTGIAKAEPGSRYVIYSQPKVGFSRN